MRIRYLLNHKKTSLHNKPFSGLLNRLTAFFKPRKVIHFPFLATVVVDTGYCEVYLDNFKGSSSLPIEGNLEERIIHTLLHESFHIAAFEVGKLWNSEEFVDALAEEALK